jgi:hypothetical protein
LPRYASVGMLRRRRSSEAIASRRRDRPSPSRFRATPVPLAVIKCAVTLLPVA